VANPISRVSGISAGLALALALSVFALGGCSLLPHAPNRGDNSQGSGSNNSESQQKATLPASFPTDIPLVGNDYAYALTVSDSSWAVLVRVDDAKSGFAKASDLLTGAGFEKNSDIGGEGGGVSLGLFTTDTYTIQMTASTDPEFGPIVKYTVVKKT
jgi:hypothetical protein